MIDTAAIRQRHKDWKGKTTPGLKVLAMCDEIDDLRRQLAEAKTENGLWIRRLAFVFDYIENDVPDGPIAVDFPNWWGDRDQMEADMQAERRRGRRSNER